MAVQHRPRDLWCGQAVDFNNWLKRYRRINGYSQFDEHATVGSCMINRLIIVGVLVLFASS